MAKKRKSGFKVDSNKGGKLITVADGYRELVK